MAKVLERSIDDVERNHYTLSTTESLQAMRLAQERTVELQRKHLSDFDIWLAGDYEYIGGNWYHAEDNNGEKPLAMIELFDLFLTQLTQKI